ncbi:MAG: hypothetical protein AAFS07_04875 [Pseudomonadota bacterium]
MAEAEAAPQGEPVSAVKAQAEPHVLRRDGLRPLSVAGNAIASLGGADADGGQHALLVLLANDGRIGFSARFEPSQALAARAVYSAGLVETPGLLASAVRRHDPAEGFQLVDPAPDVRERIATAQRGFRTLADRLLPADAPPQQPLC